MLGITVLVLTNPSVFCSNTSWSFSGMQCKKKEVSHVLSLSLSFFVLANTAISALFSELVSYLVPSSK